MQGAVMTPFTLGVPLTMVTVLGLLLNAYILVVVVLTKQVHTANNLLLLHLGAVDSLLCAVFLFFSAPSLLRGGAGSWLGHAAPCSLHGFLFTLLHPVALWTVCGLNCDRYYAISAPLHYAAVVSTRKLCKVSRETRRRAMGRQVALGLAAAWLLALTLCLPPLFLVAPYRYSPGMAGCAPDFALGDGALWYSAVYTLLTLLLPAALILGCNIKVLMIARYHRHRIASAIFEVTLSAQVTITHQRNPFTPPVLAPTRFKGRNAFSTVLQLLGSLLVLYFPYYGVIIWESSTSTLLAHKMSAVARVNPHLVMLASTLLTCSPPVNGLLYGVRNKILRKTFQNYWRKQMSKSEMNQEIQARTPSTCGSRRPSLTPLGLFGRPGAPQQRRLSDVMAPQQRAHMQRIASEMDWRPATSVGFTFDAPRFLHRSKSYVAEQRGKAASCNTLQVPVADDEPAPALAAEELADRLKTVSRGEAEDQPSRGASLFLQRVFGLGQPAPSPPRRSPRILITRAYSEESDHAPQAPCSPARHYSTSTTSLLDRRWRRCQSRQRLETASLGSSPGGCRQHGSKCSCSSTEEEDDEDEGSDASSGRLYFSLDASSAAPLCCSSDSGDRKAEQAPGSHVLSWPTRRKSGPSGPSLHLARSSQDVSEPQRFQL